MDLKDWFIRVSSNDMSYLLGGPVEVEFDGDNNLFVLTWENILVRVTYECVDEMNVGKLPELVQTIERMFKDTVENLMRLGPGFKDILIAALMEKGAEKVVLEFCGQSKSLTMIVDGLERELDLEEMEDVSDMLRLIGEIVDDVYPPENEVTKLEVSREVSRHKERSKNWGRAPI